MSQYDDSNFYANTDSLETLIKKYTDSIDELNDIYFDFDNTVSGIEENNLWTGEAYDKFKEEYETWRDNYLLRLSQLIQLKNVLKELKGIVESLIDERDSLANILEVE